MAWRCQFLAARPSQDGSVIAEKRLSEELSVHPTHWLISTQTSAAPRREARVPRACKYPVPDNRDPREGPGPDGRPVLLQHRDLMEVARNDREILV